jgi:hypothetical protein
MIFDLRSAVMVLILLGSPCKLLRRYYDGFGICAEQYGLIFLGFETGGGAAGIWF